ncbi:Transposon Ty3-I Gag-Pol polyprotein [Araneus ventricosus]|uniref:RNA-directed DNA polymerase n=1 Tax=Araneus ventricosus TaxID=182803 RepID=A0A4Y2PMS2_ARAVE|nr:Transposon Ty3-I Gag-Pol polyprotein [Araneus ventricosus]
METTNIVLEAYGGYKLRPVGMINLLCSIGNKQANINFVIIENSKSKPLLGLEGCIKLNLVKCIDKVSVNMYQTKTKQFIENNKEIFTGVGKFEGKYTIKLKENAVPVAGPPRRIPVSLRPKVEEKLKKLENEGIIAKVDNPQGWVSNLVVVEKTDGSIRLCLDPKDLNKVIKRDYVLIPKIEELVPKLTHKIVFSVLDLKDGFVQIELDDKSSDLCTFSSPFGCYKFLRLPMGLSCAPEIFQKRNEANFNDIPGVLVYFDDLLIAGDTIEQHDEILGKVIKRAKELNIKFNQNKIQLKVPEVKYLGYIFTSEGMKPDPDYVQAIIDMPEPRNKTELQRILGMINYLRQFIPQASTISAPLRELLKKSTVWHWLPVHETALKTLKYKIASVPVLSVFKSSKSIVIQADSSKDGLCCCLLQDGRPVAFASRSLTETEKGYAQIEKEFLSIVFAVTKFHYFIYGSQVEVLTDHKPLLSVMSKSVGNVMSPRLQRMKLKLLKYQLSLTYLLGKYMYIADLLSRAYIVKPLKDDIEMTELVHSLTKHLQISESRKKEFKEATLSDVGLSHVLKFWNEGWPSNGQNISPEAWEYFKFRDNIYVEEGLVFLNDRVIVPVSLRSEMLNILHQAHCGMEKARARARQVLFWPGITKDIENMVSKCKTCERYRPRNVKEPLICHEVPNLPYEKIGTDICEHGGNSYLIIGCYLSKWLDIIKLSDKTSDEIIAKLKAVFSTHGIPKIIVCDNMPFASIKMKKFSREWGV